MVLLSRLLLAVCLFCFAAVNRFRHRFPALLGIWLLLFVQLMPALGHAAVAKGLIEVDLCSAHGHRAFIEPLSGDVLIVEAGAELPPVQSEQTSVASCVLCCGHVSDEPLLLPALAATVAFAPIRFEAKPSLFLLAPRPLFAWSPANPRAPPVAH